MSNFRLRAAYLIRWTAVMAFVLTLGCGEPDLIRRYQVPHEMTPVSPAATSASDGAQRMLGAIIAGDNEAWFVKVLGPTDQVEGVAEAYEQMIESWRFPAGESGPKWTLPAGWTERGADENRFATLEVKGLEIAISKLPWDTTDWDAYVLANVNRWRRQVKLPPIPVESLAESTRQTEIDGRPTVLVDITSAGTPAAGMNAAAPAQGDERASSSEASPLKYEQPDGWIPGRTSTFRIAAFQIQRDGREAEVTLIPLGTASGTLLENVNRWRAQVGLETIDQDQLDATVQTLVVDGIESAYVDVVPPETTDPSSIILAVVVPLADQTLFIKLMGDRQLVTEERPNFERFVRSIRFPATP